MSAVFSGGGTCTVIFSQSLYKKDVYRLGVLLFGTIQIESGKRRRKASFSPFCNNIPIPISLSILNKQLLELCGDTYKYNLFPSRMGRGTAVFMIP